MKKSTIRFYSLFFLWVAVIPLPALAQKQWLIPKSVLLDEHPDSESLKRFRQFLFFSIDSLQNQSLLKKKADYVQENSEKKIRIDFLTSEPDIYDSVWYARAMNLPEAQRFETGNDSVKIAIIDTGIFFEHQVLKDSYWRNSKEQINGIDDDGNGFEDDIFGYDFVLNRGITQLSDDRNGHGTAMASLAAGRPAILAEMRGIAPKAKLMSVRAFDENGLGTMLDIARAIVYAADSGADIINMSFGDGFSSYLIESAVKYAFAKNVILVASAGNVGGVSPRYPAAYPQVLAVSWLAQNLRIAPTANYGSHISFSAPGTKIHHAKMSTNGLTNLYETSSGSSASAAIVSGAIAWYKMVYPEFTNFEIMDVIRTHVLDISETGMNVYYGYGMPILEIPKENRINQGSLLSMEIAEMYQDSLQLWLDVIGSGIRDWQISVYSGKTMNSEPLVLYPKQNQLYRGKLSLPFDSDHYKEKGFVLSLEATFWNGRFERVNKAIFAAEPNPSIMFKDEGWAVDGGKKSGFQLWQSSFNGAAQVSLFDENNQILEQSNPVREGVDHVFRFDAQSFEQARLSKATQHIWSQTVQNEESRTRLLDEVHTKDLSAAIQPENVDLNVSEVWKIPFKSNAGDSAWYFVLQRTENSNYQIVIYASEKFQESNKIIDLPYRFIPKQIYVHPNTGKPAYVLGYGGGRTYIFNATENFILMGYNSFGDFVYAAGIADTDGDGKPEIWAHNRTKWAVFELDSGTWNKITEIDFPEAKKNSVLGSAFQVPNLAFTKNHSSSSLLNVVTADFFGNLYFIKTLGDNQWQKTQTIIGGFYGNGNALIGMKTSGGQDLVVTARHSFPGVDEKGNQSKEWLALEFWQHESDSLHLRSKLFFTDFDFNAISMIPYSKDSLLLVLSPYLYKIKLKNERTEVEMLAHESDISSAFIGNKNIALSLRSTGKWKEILFDENLETAISPTFKRFIFGNSEGIAYQNVFADSIQIKDENEVLLAKEKVFNNDDYLMIPLSADMEREVKISMYDSSVWQPVFQGVLSQQTLPILQGKWLSKSEIVFQASDTVQKKSIQPENIGQIHPHALYPLNNEVLLARFPDNFADSSTADSRELSRIFSVKNLPFEVHIPSISYEMQEQKSFLIRAEIEDYETILLSLSSSKPLTGLPSFSIKPMGKVESVRLKAQNGDVYQYQLKIAESHLLHAGLVWEITINDIDFKEPANRVSAVYQKQDSETFGINEAISYPSPWVLSKTPQVRFSKIPENARILILNANGNPIAELDGVGASGSIHWDGKDAFGKQIHSGIYFYQVILGTKRSNLKKIAIIR